MDEQPAPADEPHDHSEAGWPQRQVYFITVEWLDTPHTPESPERLARALRQVIQRSHNLPHDAEPARFVVRVKLDDVAAEAEGRIEHHHH